MKADMGKPDMSNQELHERLQSGLGRMDTQEAGRFSLLLISPASTPWIILVP